MPSRLPDADEACAELRAEAERLFPGNLMAVFALNYLWKQTGHDCREDGDWRA
jgi:hypothetical protein